MLLALPGSLSAIFALANTAIVQTDYRSNVFADNGVPQGTDNPSFVQNEVMLGLRAAF